MNDGAPRRVVSLGGVDPCGGAGITADAIVAAWHGVELLPIAVALTVQNRHGFAACDEVKPRIWRAALEAVLADGAVHAVKTGLLGSASAVRLVAAALRPLHGRVPIVVDPVLAATAGGYEANTDVARAIADHLVPLATIVTPNTNEHASLFDGDVGVAFAVGCSAVLRKGGHEAGEMSMDVLSRPGAPDRHFARRRLPVGAVHGTGCALATAIACELARDADVAAASQRAGDWLWSRLATLGPAPPDGPPRPLPLTRTSA